MDRFPESSFPSPSNTMGSTNPRNRYLATLLEEFGKVTEHSNELSKLQKEYQTTQRELSNVLQEVKQLKNERQMEADKIASLQKELTEQKLLHLQLRNEASNEFVSLHRKHGSRDKEIGMLKFQNRMNVRKAAFDLENLKWEVKHGNGISSSSSTSRTSASVTDSIGL